MFEEIDTGIGKSLYADDGALWIKGQSLRFIEKKMQDATTKVEQ